MKVPQFRSFVDKDDWLALEGVFENNYIAEGPYCQRFKEGLLDITGADDGVFASNGTVALYLAMRGLGIGTGDEVLVQDLTFIASATSVEMAGATPVFVDIVSYDDPSIDLDKIVLTPNTKAMVIAHLFGTACSNIEQVAAFCSEHNLLLIEDAAQALTITNGETHCGMFGDVGTFSFYADKTITTAEGGFVISNNDELIERMRYLRNQGRLQSGSFVHPEIGYNFRMTDMQGALGVSQLAKLDTIKTEKAKLYKRYRDKLGDAVGFLKVRDDFSFVPFRVIVFVDDAESTMKRMAEDGIEPRSVFFPLHRQPCFQHFPSSSGEYPVSDEMFKRGICLPTWVGLSEEQIDYTAESLLAAI